MVTVDLTVTPEDSSEDTETDNADQEKPPNNDNNSDNSNDSNDDSNNNSNSSTGNSNSKKDTEKIPSNDEMGKARLREAIEKYSEWAVEEYPQLHDIDLSTVTVEISNMKTQAGKAIYKKSEDRFIMRFSKRAYEEWGWDEFTSTIRHELIHIWQYQKFGSGDHGRTFKRKAEALGCSVNCETFHDEYKYKLFCSECGDFVAGRHKMCKSVKEPEEFRSKCCKAALKSETA